VPDIITWYDFLGLTAGASPDTIRYAYDGRVRQLKPEVFAGAPSPVLLAAIRARESVEGAWLVLGDSERRHRYDTQIGMYRRRRSGFADGPVQHGQDPYDAMRLADRLFDGDVVYSFRALMSWMAPLPSAPRRRLIVPDVRGLFYQACRAVVTMAGLRMTAVRLTPDPLPVEGLVIGQSPSPGSAARHHSALTVQLWHPARRD
jgi:hypothetical protein